MLMSLVFMLIALLLDWLIGEVKRWHPLVGFGHIANWLEHHFNHSSHNNPVRFFMGLLAWSLAVLPLTVLIGWLCQLSYFNLVLPALILYCCLGHRSLYDHISPIIKALQENNREQAKRYTSYIVSRDPAHIEVEKASIESVLENGNDAIFGALFWFMVLGVPGVVLYRLANTLDAMWGYRTSRFDYFGKTAARIDDVLNLIPARLTALSYTLLGHTRFAWHCWRTQARLWDSPNAGPVMAAGAGALNISLGGAAVYHGEIHQRPQLGTHPTATTADISRALYLVSRAVLLWLVVYALICGVSYA